MRAEEFDQKLDDGEDVTGDLDISAIRRPALEQRRVNVALLSSGELRQSGTNAVGKARVLARGAGGPGQPDATGRTRPWARARHQAEREESGGLFGVASGGTGSGRHAGHGRFIPVPRMTSGGRGRAPDCLTMWWPVHR